MGKRALFYKKKMWLEFQEYLNNAERPDRFRTENIELKIVWNTNDEEENFVWRFFIDGGSATFCYYDTWRPLVKFAPSITLYMEILEKVRKPVFLAMNMLVQKIRNDPNYIMEKQDNPIGCDNEFLENVIPNMQKEKKTKEEHGHASPDKLKNLYGKCICNL